MFYPNFQFQESNITILYSANPTKNANLIINTGLIKILHIFRNQLDQF